MKQVIENILQFPAETWTRYEGIAERDVLYQIGCRRAKVDGQALLESIVYLIECRVRQREVWG